jgi:hypothetical protein
MDDDDALHEGRPFEDEPALFDYLFGPEQPVDDAETPPTAA